MTDPHSGRVLFRGTAEDRASRRAERNERKADEAVAEIFEKSPWGREPDE
jgi:hypothetical protein